MSKIEISNWLNNHRLFKNFVGGMILIVGMVISLEVDLLPSFVEGLLYSIPAWLILFNWNYK